MLELDIKGILLLFFIGAFFVTYTLIPIIIKIVEYKNFTDKPNHRSSHSKNVPTLGGIAFYVTLIFVLFFIEKWDDSNVSIYIIPGLTILFLAGLKDDILVISPASKLTAQVLAIIFVLANETMQIRGLSGFLGINQIPFYLSVLISVFTMIVIINAYNLIDGIDGLASIIGIIISTTFGFGFYFLQLYYFAILSVVVIAMLAAFLRFNLSYKNKIFMGDTGSLIIGFMISIFTIKFLAIDADRLEKIPFYLENIPLVLLAILVIPMFDFGRVFFIRLFNKKNPFKPDRNHTHHILIDLGISHSKVSIILGILNVLLILLMIYLSTRLKNIPIILIFCIVIIILFYILYRLNFSFSNLRKKLFFRNKMEDFKSKIKNKKH